MRHILFSLFLVLAPASMAEAQTVVNIAVPQNPVLRASAATMSAPLAPGGTLLGADLAVEGGDGHYSYLWTDSQGTSLGTASTLRATSQGDYFLRVSDGAGCAVSVKFTVKGTTAIDSHSSDGRLAITLQGRTLRITGPSDRTAVTVATTDGRIVMRTAAASLPASVDLSRLSRGCYIVCATSRGEGRMMTIVAE